MPKQAIIHSSLDVREIIETPIPNPEAHEVVIKVVVSGSNPKDWKYPLWKDLPHNSGDDIAGVVHSVGKDAYEFKPGDRVAAMHEFGKENGSFAEYAVAPSRSTFHLAPSVSFEEAATVPIAALTAAMALFVDLELSLPWEMRIGDGAAKKTPLLIYGIGSAVGAFAAKLARLAGISPIIGVAGGSKDFASTLVDYVVDYREGEDALVTLVEEILAKEGLGTKLPRVFDAISENGSLEATARFIDPNGGLVSIVLPPALFAKDKENFRYPDGVTSRNTALPLVHTTHQDFCYIWSRYISRILSDGRLTPHPHVVVPGGLDGVFDGLRKLQMGEASAVKYVFRIEETGDVPVTAPIDLGGREKRPNRHPLRNFPFPAED